MALITNSIRLAKDTLDSRNVVAIPTETVYGLAANGTENSTLQKIYEAKGRPINNPLILHFKNFDSIVPFVDQIPNDVDLLAKKFWPGPLTLLLPKSSGVPEMVTAGSNRVAVRIPNHPVTLELLESLDYPLAAPSANPSGYISPTRPEHVQTQLGNKIPLILDGGPCDSGIESTILGWNDDREPIVYRQGAITVEDISAVLGKTPKLNQKNKVLLAPGMSTSHYAPKTETFITKNVTNALEQYKGEKIGLISFETSYQDRVKIEKEIVLSPTGSINEMAQKLYAAMYRLDVIGLDVLIIELAPEKGIGMAINDRLRRSSSENKTS